MPADQSGLCSHEDRRPGLWSCKVGLFLSRVVSGHQHSADAVYYNGLWGPASLMNTQRFILENSKENSAFSNDGFRTL